MASTYELIGKVILGADAANIEFTSIPATFSDLFISLSARSDRNSSPSMEDSLKIRINGDSGSNYTSRILYGATNNNNVSSASEATTYAVCYVAMTSTANTASTFGNAAIYIPNYAGSTNKSFSVEGVSEQNGANAGIGAAACLWSSTNAITSVLLFPYWGSNLKSGSSAYLYGISHS